VKGQGNDTLASVHQVVAVAQAAGGNGAAGGPTQPQDGGRGLGCGGVGWGGLDAAWWMWVWVGRLMAAKSTGCEPHVLTLTSHNPQTPADPSLTCINTPPLPQCFGSADAASAACVQAHPSAGQPLRLRPVCAHLPGVLCGGAAPRTQQTGGGGGLEGEGWGAG
jgi:hypothetical protein